MGVRLGGREGGEEEGKQEAERWWVGNEEERVVRGRIGREYNYRIEHLLCRSLLSPCLLPPRSQLLSVKSQVYTVMHVNTLHRHTMLTFCSQRPPSPSICVSFVLLFSGQRFEFGGKLTFAHARRGGWFGGRVVGKQVGIHWRIFSKLHADSITPVEHQYGRGLWANDPGRSIR